MRWFLILLLLGMCSEPAPTPTVQPVDETDSESVEEPDDDPEPEATPVVLELPEEIPEVTNLPHEARRILAAGGHGRHGVEWHFVAHPDEGVRETLSVIVEGLSRGIGAMTEFDASCSVPLATEHLVAVSCVGRYAARGGFINVVRNDATYAIVDGRLEPVAVEDAFLAHEEIRTMLTERCEARRRARLPSVPEDSMDRWRAEYPCDQGELRLTLVPQGVRGVFTYFENFHRSADLSWSDVRNQIRGDGFLAPVLADGTYAHPRVEPDQANAWAVSEYGLEGDLIQRWMRIEGEPGLAVARFAGGLGRLVLPGTDVERARRIAGALGAEARPMRLGAAGAPGQVLEAVPLRWVRTTEDLNLRRGIVTALIARGSLVVARGGELRRAGELVSVVTALGNGSLASRHLRAYEDCVPDPAREGSSHVASVRVRRSGRATDAWLVVSRDRVELREQGEACSFGDEILAFDVQGRLFDVRMTGTTEHGGSSIVVAGSYRRRVSGLHYVAYRVGSRGPVLEETLRFDPRHSDGGNDEDAADRLVRLSETADGTYFPVTTEEHGNVRRFVWSSGRLELAVE